MDPQLPSDTPPSSHSVAPASDRIRRQVGWAAAIGLVLLTVLLLAPISMHSRAAGSLGDLVHAPLFCGVAWAALTLWQRLRPGRSVRRWWIDGVAVVLAVLGISILLEWLQYWSGRTASRQDVLSNAMGALCGWIVHALRHPGIRWSGPLRILAVSTLPLAFVIAWQYPARILWDVYRVDAAFPLLASFESHAELSRWYAQNASRSRVRRDATEGQWAYQLTCRPGPFSGATLIEVHSDWSSIAALELDVIVDPLPGVAAYELLIKVVDREGQDDHRQTFRHQRRILPGMPTPIRLSRDAILHGPDDRLLDLTQILFVDVFLLDPPAGAVMRIDHVRVTPLTTQGTGNALMSLRRRSD